MKNTYRLKVHPRAKSIRITVNAEGVCVVTIPKRGPREFILKQAEAFVDSKRDWISRNVEKIEARKLAAAHAPKYTDIELKKKTLEIVTERLAHFNAFYGYSYHDVRVKKVSSRWGSCSKKGNLNFSHRLALLSPEEIDYVVVHELCHLGEFNHSPRFWNLVQKTIPDYRAIQKGMRGKIF